MSPVRALPLRREHSAGLVALFERADSTCFCRWWHFPDDKNAWLDRNANAPERNRHELCDSIERGSEEARGIVALSGDGSVVGFMKLAPAPALQKLYAQRLYRALPVFTGDRSRVLAIGCFLVDPAWRRRGVAHALLDAGKRHAIESGASAIEAFPRRAAGVPDEQLWTGPESLFVRAGFVLIHDAPYPVLRFDVSR